MKDRKQGKKVMFMASHEDSIVGGFYVSNLTKDQIKTIISWGGQVDGLECYIEVDVSVLEDQVSSSDGFVIAENYYKTFAEYTEYIVSLDGTKALLYCDYDNDVWYSPARFQNLQAYINKFGIDNIYLDIDDEDLTTDYTVSGEIIYEVELLIAQLDELSWAELKEVINNNGLSGEFDLRYKDSTIEALYAGLRNNEYTIVLGE